MDGRVDYHVEIADDIPMAVLPNLPTITIPASHIKANIVTTSKKTQPRKRKCVNKH